ncbi:MAG: alpha/beta fold hydrolase [Sphingobacteriaceae bacterium]
MTPHYFDHDLANLHYYQFGSGKQNMLCFHGYGMHGKQFRILEESLGSKYTFYGFDLFFHKETRLKNQGLDTIKKGLSKQDFAFLIRDFCLHEKIARFSVLGYSMGTHYATAVAEAFPLQLDEYIVVAPSSLNPGSLIRFFSKNKIGNRLLEKLTLNEKALTRMLRVFKSLHLLDRVGYDILYKEIATAELRLNFYACFTYLRFLETDQAKLLKVLQQENIKSIFVFGKRDRMYPPTIGRHFLPQLKQAQVLVLDENHDMINQNFASALSNLLLQAGKENGEKNL